MMKNLLYSLSILLAFSACNKKPEADFTWSPQTPKVGQEVQFTNKTMDAKKYSWNLGNAKISDEENPRNSYDVAGNYTVDLTATSGAKSDTKTMTIEVIP